MTARLLVHHHRGPDAEGIEVIVRRVDQRIGRGRQEARDEALAQECALAITAIGIEAVADDALAVADDVGDDGHDRRGHLREVDIGVGDR